MKPLGKVKLEWSADLAYAIGLIVTDGCLYKDGRHINLTSKDEEQIRNFLHCIDLPHFHVGRKGSGLGMEKKYFQVQIGDVVFYKFLNEIGVTPNKSKTVGAIKIPDEYFFDFCRGLHDGDGAFYSYWDPRWHSSYMFYTVFSSASAKHIFWLQEKINKLIGIVGHITTTGKTPMTTLKYAKNESLILLPEIYYNPHVICLSRKRDKIQKALAIEGCDLFSKK